MTKVEFSFWLLEIFCTCGSPILEEYDWLLLLIDNCSAHADFTTLEKLNRMNLAIAHFPPNSTHCISPLDIVIYGSLQRKLSKDLEIVKTLPYSNIGSLIEPALRSVFSRSIIRAAFHATGFWYKVVRGVDIDKFSRQYSGFASKLPDAWVKANKEKRTQLAIRCELDKFQTKV